MKRRANSEPKANAPSDILPQSTEAPSAPAPLHPENIADELRDREGMLATIRDLASAVQVIAEPDQSESGDPSRRAGLLIHGSRGARGASRAPLARAVEGRPGHRGLSTCADQLPTLAKKGARRGNSAGFSASRPAARGVSMPYLSRRAEPEVRTGESRSPW
jgi:hypothetical protein